MIAALNIKSQIIDAIKYIESGKKTIAPVVREKKLIGTISDGDIRRAILNGSSLEDNIDGVFNKDPIYAELGINDEAIMRILNINSVEAIPIVDDKNNFIKIIHITELSSNVAESLPKSIISDLSVLILAGGKGKRLLPLTENVPKPMVKVGNMPIIERQIRHLSSLGIDKIYISTNYLEDVIVDYFKTNIIPNVDIEYISEKQFLGTAGPLSLMPNFENLLLINGDLLSDVSYIDMYKFHLEESSSLTIGGVYQNVEIPYGVIDMKKQKFLRVNEKPSQRFLCNAGIYIIKPEAKDLVPAGEYFDMTDLIEAVNQDEKKVSVFPIHENWIDIGDPNKLQYANESINE